MEQNEKESSLGPINFFILKKCDRRTEFYMQFFSWRLSAELLLVGATALARALHSTAQACAC